MVTYSSHNLIPPLTQARAPQARWRCVGVACLALAAFLPLSDAHAADYVVGVQDLDYFPIYATDAQGEYRGYGRELLDLFAKRSGIQFIYQVRPVRRLVNDYLAGRVDLMFPDNPNWDKDRKVGLEVNYSAPALVFQDAVMVLPDNLGQPLQSLGSVMGFTPWKFMADVNAGKLRLHEAPGPLNLIKMALAGRVQGVNMARQVAEYHLRTMDQPDALVPDLGLLPSRDSQYLLSSIRYPELIRQFDQFLQTDKAAVLALKRKYGL